MEKLKYMKLVISFMLLLAGLSMQAQVLSLDSVLRRVEEQHPLLQQYLHKAKAMDAFAKGSTSWMAPMVGVGNFMTPYPNEEVMDDSDKGAFMLSVEQDIPNPFKLRAKRKYYESLSATQTFEQKEVWNKLRAQARQYYYTLLVLEKKRSVLKASERNMLLMKKLADIRQSYTNGNLAAIYRAEASLYETQNMLQMTESAIQNNKVLLNMLMNRKVETAIEVDTNLMKPALVTQTDTATVAGKRNDIKRMDQEIQSMRLNINMMKADALPDFKIRYEHMEANTGHMPNQYTAMAMISIPIAPWSSRMYRSQVSGMRHEIEAMKKQREAMLIETSGMINGMWFELSSMQKQLEAYELKILPALQKSYQSTLLAYEENRSELSQLAAAGENLNMAQMKVLDLWQQYYLMLAAYEKELDQ